MSWQTDWKVDKDVKIPSFRNQSGKHKELDNFLQALEIGDSFVIHPKVQPDGSIKGYIGQNIVTRAKKLGMKLASRKMYSDEDPNIYYYRIWFIENIDPKVKNLHTKENLMPRLQKNLSTTWLRADCPTTSCS